MSELIKTGPGRPPLRVFTESAAGFNLMNAQVICAYTPTYAGEYKADGEQPDGVEVEIRGFGRYKRRRFTAERIERDQRGAAIAGVAEMELLYGELAGGAR